MGLMDLFRASSIKQENVQLHSRLQEMEQLEKQLREKIQEAETREHELTDKLHESVLHEKQLQSDIQEMSKRASDLGITEYYQAKEKIDEMQRNADDRLRSIEEKLRIHSQQADKEITEKTSIIARQKAEIVELAEQNSKLTKQISTQMRKLSRSKELYKSIEYALENFFVSDVQYTNCKLSKTEIDDLELISPSVILKLHAMDMKDLRKAYRENEKQIDNLLNKYSIRYTTKANKSIYNLMVIALRAELQNILYNLKYEKLDEAVSHVKDVTAKYLKIAAEGNQNIAGTLTKFIGEIEYLFISAVKIEYNYYVKKEQAKQEQLALKEQMRQEAEERKALEIERKKVEQEETKFNNEIDKLKEQMASAQNEELEKLNARILELQSQLADVVIKKEEISNLANGKAGNVYIISNLGSFGENVFKIGMTRRLNPQDRVNELGDASVPFKFDVHSFIFSDDAVGLESKLHSTLNKQRVNKVNIRKEFFYTTVDELEALVTEIEPTAEFNKTMLAEEFRQSQSATENYTNTFVSEDYEEE